jgi:hypothetical protein
MKKGLFVLVISVIVFSNGFFSQVGETYNINVTNKQSSAEQIQKAQQLRAEREAQSEAQNAEEMRDNYSNIKVDFLKNNSDKYENVIIKSVIGWAPGGNLVNIIDLLRGSNRKVYNELVFKRDGGTGYKKPYNYVISIPEDVKNNSKTLFLSWSREATTDYTRVSILTLEDINGDVIFEAEYKNKAYSEMLYPITSSNYADNYTREEAIQKLKDSKELLELGVISQEEYNELVKKLKPFLLK